VAVFAVLDQDVTVDGFTHKSAVRTRFLAVSEKCGIDPTEFPNCLLSKMRQPEADLEAVYGLTELIDTILPELGISRQLFDEGLRHMQMVPLLFMAWIRREFKDFEADFDRIVDFADGLGRLWYSAPSFVVIDLDQRFKAWSLTEKLEFSGVRVAARECFDAVVSEPVLLASLTPRRVLDMTERAVSDKVKAQQCFLQAVQHLVHSREHLDGASWWILVRMVHSAFSQTDIGPEQALRALRRWPEWTAYKKCLDARRNVVSRFDEVPFEKRPAFMKFFEHGFFVLASLLIIPIAWYFGAIPGVVHSELTAVC
jgi:hypothetical protein